MRLPGAVNFKDASNLKQVAIAWRSSKQYNHSDLEQDLPPEPQEMKAKRSDSSQLPLIYFPGVDEGKRNNEAARIAGIHFAQDKDFETVIEEMRAWNQTNRPPLNDEELVRTINSIYRKHVRQTTPGAA